MARHIDPDDDSFRRSLLRAFAGGVVAMVVTFGVTALLTQLGGDAPDAGPVVFSDAPVSGPEPSPPEVEPTQEPGSATAAPTETVDATDATAPADEGPVTVQVLDAVGSGTYAEDAAALLRELGYEVVVVNPTPRRPAETTVLVTPGSEAAAQELAEQDPRFANTGVNRDFNPDVDLHILVTEDFAQG